jgi:ubiquinone/menaquinone biosynthesis C-methylase UbiE
MPTDDTIINDKQSATEYDRRARETHWFGPEVIFGLTYEFVKPGDSLLDLGIGSGLSSILFHQAGLRVYSLDGSSEVLEACQTKGFAVELKQHDLRDLPLPYPSRFFDHVVCVAVLNSFKDLEPLFREITRIMKEHGVFAFTVEEQKPGQADQYMINRVEVSENLKRKRLLCCSDTAMIPSPNYSTAMASSHSRRSSFWPSSTRLSIEMSSSRLTLLGKGILHKRGPGK